MRLFLCAILTVAMISVTGGCSKKDNSTDTTPAKPGAAANSELATCPADHGDTAAAEPAAVTAGEPVPAPIAEAQPICGPHI